MGQTFETEAMKQIRIQRTSRSTMVSTYQDKATIDSNAVHAGPKSCGGWKKV